MYKRRLYNSTETTPHTRSSSQLEYPKNGEWELGI
jgi:hypothetical protein